MLKRFFVLFGLLFVFLNFSFANNYTLYYWQGCPHCAKVEHFMEQQNITGIQKKEVWFNKQNRKEFLDIIRQFKITDAGVPFLYVQTKTWSYYKMWDEPIINYLKTTKLDFTPIKKSKTSDFVTQNFSWKFLLVLIPAAISDSINPCAFAVILILLGSIFILYRSRKKVLLAGLAFSLSIFLSYFAMGLWLYKALANVENTLYLKFWVGILGILVWLANLKDAFWPGKLFVMEVPLSWRPKLKAILSKATSPFGAFIIWFLVSLFLLPCTSWPYLTILGYLSAESSSINLLGYVYLLIYNLIFILPMVIITFLVSINVAYVEKFKNLKDKYNWLIHLIVWLLMLWLGIYVILDTGLITLF